MLTVTLAANGCTGALKGVPQAELARLRDQSEVIAVHYPSPPFLLRKTNPPQGIVAGGPSPLALLLLPVVIGTVVVATAVHNAEERASSEELANEVKLEDPVVGLKDRLAARLATEAGIRQIWPVASVMDADDVKSLTRAFGSATVLDVKIVNWGLHFQPADPKTFLALYRVRARLVRLDQGNVVWNAEVTCGAGADRRFGTPTLDELKADGGALLKTTMATAADACVEPLLARFRGQEPPRPSATPNESTELTLEHATLSQAEADLFGAGGLVHGSRRFDAKFKDVALTAHDLPRLRALMREATASPWRSEVQVRGTIDGRAFKAKMEKNGAGRSEFMFEGLRFADEAQAGAFLAPLQGRGVRQVKLEGFVAGRPIKIILSGTSASTRPSTPPVAVSPTEPASPRVAVAPTTPPSSAPPTAERSGQTGVVGTWSGTIYGQEGSYPLKITFKDDGTYHAMSATLNPSSFEGTWQLSGGTVVWKSITTGRTGTAMVREANGERTLRIVPNDRTYTAELTATTEAAVPVDFRTWLPGHWDGRGGGYHLTISSNLEWDYTSTVNGRWYARGTAHIEGPATVVLEGWFDGTGSSAGFERLTMVLHRDGESLAGEFRLSRTWLVTFSRAGRPAKK
jgi:hypothetical protein